MRIANEFLRRLRQLEDGRYVSLFQIKHPESVALEEANAMQALQRQAIGTHRMIARMQPGNTIMKVRRLAVALELRYAAVDMAIDSGGNLVFFEANHSGQWGYIEKETGHPITQSIAEELVSRAQA